MLETQRIMGDFLSEKEYILECECGAKYKFQGNKDDLDKYLESQTWMCELGRHVELGNKGDYLKIVEERDKVSKQTEVESKKKDECTVAELQEKFGTEMEHVGFGVFKDPDGNVWDYRLGSKGERLYSKT
jgi:hypothetical protein